MPKKYVLWFNEVDKDDVGKVGGKGANLGEMTAIGVPVPPGFIVTAGAYFAFLEKGKLKKKIAEYLLQVDFDRPQSLQHISGLIKNLILKTEIPPEISGQIIEAYFKLKNPATLRGFKTPLLNVFSALKSFSKEPLVAVRSSATAEDLPQASFAGQQVTFLNVKGEASLVSMVRECWASLFEPRAIFYRHEQHFDHFRVGIAVPVQMMVESDTSGIMFTLDPVTNDKTKIVIEAIYGLGELIVQGEVTPDHYEIEKKSLAIISKSIVKQTQMLTRKNQVTKEREVAAVLGAKQKITNAQILQLGRIGKILEEHYYFPQDIEWAIQEGKVFIVQTRPVTTIKIQNSKFKIPACTCLRQEPMAGRQNYNAKLKNEIQTERKIILKGSPASPGITAGVVRIIKSASEIGQVKNGEVLVTLQTNPDFVPAMRRAVAIVTERGGRTSHAAIVSRELGIPAVVGADRATKVLRIGELVTVNGTTGEVYQGGLLKGEGIKLNSTTADGTFGLNPKLSERLKTATKVYVNLAQPDRVNEIAQLNVDGVGLLRAEFMVADIGFHPKKLIADGKEEIFIDKMSSNLAKFCVAFHPRPVVYRATDFKTNEYRNLVGGSRYEPEEPNPMLGFRGSYRYIADPQVFNLEIEAIKRVRHKLGLKNLHLMIPFVRTVREMIEVKKLLSGYGLLRSPMFKLWMMVEIPSNVILIEEFLQAGIDGVSIGSNDLTMLTLGTDRDNSEVAKEFDERNDAVVWALERVIKACHKYKVTSSICGQAPSDYPELVEQLVGWGITSVSVNPDAVERTRQIVSAAEKKLVSKNK